MSFFNVFYEKSQKYLKHAIYIYTLNTLSTVQGSFLTRWILAMYTDIGSPPSVSSL